MRSEGESIDNNSSYSKPTSTYCLQPVLANWNPNQLTETLLYGEEDLDNIKNTSILNATINYLIETKRFNAERFLWTPDVMALTMMLHLKFIFLFFVPGILQHIHVGLVIVIFCLMCRCWNRKKTRLSPALQWKIKWLVSI